MTYDIDIDSYIGWPVSRQWVASKLRPLGGREVQVRVCSFGGDVSTALDIRQQFIDHGRVTCHIFGMTASAATILAMGARRVVMSRYALMLIHPCSAPLAEWGSYDSASLRQAIGRLRGRLASLETVDRVVANVYALRTGRTPREMGRTMEAAAWLTAEECLRLGLIDAVSEEADAKPPAPLTAEARERLTACGLTPPPAATPGSGPAISDNPHPAAPAVSEYRSAAVPEYAPPAAPEDEAPATPPANPSNSDMKPTHNPSATPITGAPAAPAEAANGGGQLTAPAAGRPSPGPGLTEEIRSALESAPSAAPEAAAPAAPAPAEHAAPEAPEAAAEARAALEARVSALERRVEEFLAADGADTAPACRPPTADGPDPDGGEGRPPSPSTPAAQLYGRISRLL